MSLLEALLNEGWRDPHEVYIAHRADGLRGSGSIDDPYDGGTRSGPSFSVNLSFNVREAVVVAQTPHCFADVQAVEIAGFAGADAALFNGDFQATRLSPQAFKITVGQPPTAPPRHPTYFPNLRCTRKPISLSSLTYQFNSGSGQHIATAKTTVAHGYCNLDPVEISGVTGSAASFFNGTFNITVDPAKPDEFTYILSGNPGSSPQGSPTSTDKQQLFIRVFWPVASAAASQPHALVQYDAVAIAGASVSAFNTSFVTVAVGDTTFHYWLTVLPIDGATATGTATKIIHRFDEAMRSLPTDSPCIVHFGPGTFETRGTCVAYLKDGSNNPDSVFVGFSVEHHGTGHGIYSRPGMGLRVVGSGMGVTTIKLVHAIDPLSQTSAFGNLSYIPVLHFHASDFTVDCNLPDQPAPAGLARAAVCVGAIGLGSRFNRLRRIRAIRAGTQAIPESFVLFLSAHYSDPEGAIHNVIEDCIVEHSNENNTYTTSVLGNVGTAYAMGRSPIVRHNYINCVFPNGSSTELLRIKEITYDATDSTLAIVETSRAHHRTIGQNAFLNGVAQKQRDGQGQLTGQILPSGFAGEFQVAGLVAGSDVKLKIKKPTDAPADVTDLLVSQSVFNAFIGTYYNGPAASNATGCVTEGNAVYDCTNPYYIDTGSMRDAVVRDNYYSSVSLGVFFNFPPGPDGVSGGVVELKSGKSLTHGSAPNEKIATFEVADNVLAFEISVGDVVTIKGAIIGTDLAPPDTYNGTFTVTWVSADKRKISYEMTVAPTADANLPTTSFPLICCVRAQIRRFVCENNLYDLYAFDNTSVSAAGGLGTVSLAGPPYIFPQAVIRGNVFRHIDNTPAVLLEIPGYPGSYYGSRACRLQSYDGALIEHNIASLSDLYPIQFLQSRNMHGFGNQAPSSQLLPLFEDMGGGGTGPFRRQDGLEDRISDALLLSFL